MIIIWVRIFACMWKGEFFKYLNVHNTPLQPNGLQNIRPNNNQNLFEHLSLNLGWKTFAQLSYWSCPTFKKRQKLRPCVLNCKCGSSAGRWWCDRRESGGEKSSRRAQITPWTHASETSGTATGVGSPVAPNVPSDLSSVWVRNSTKARFEVALLLCALEKLHKHPVITFTASKLSILLFQAFGRPSSGGIRRVERGSNGRAKICSFPEKSPVHSSLNSLPCSSSAGL